MPDKFEFPKNFYWGAATSAHQVEGNNHNDWSEWEKENAEYLALYAQERFTREANYISGYKGPLSFPEAFNKENYISGRACDHYNRFREDFDIVKELGHNAHRFSIEWSRIEPEKGKFNEKEVEHYRKVIKALRERGLEPFVALWHFTNPLWVRDEGGPEGKNFPCYFAYYAKYIVEKLGSEVTFWVTLNEPTSVIANSYLIGAWPPQKKNIISIFRVYKNLARAHCEAYKAIHKVLPTAQVGFGNNMQALEPLRKRSLDSIAAWFRDLFSNRYFLWLTGNTHDYLGLQYYYHSRIKFPIEVQNENKKVSDMGWELYPEGLYQLLLRLAKYKKPVYITENGLADAKDQYRSWFIRESLKNVARAIKDGADVRGYFYWSLLDNFEWDKGFWPRFGLVEIDYKTLERKIRPSAWEYKKIIEEFS